MFSSPDDFGQLSCSRCCSPFESEPVIGQTANANNHFAPQPFGNTSTPFGSQTGNSVFGGAFGEAQSSTPFPSTTTFCGLSPPTFGPTLSTFGSTPTPAFGSSSSSSFGGSSIFGEKSYGGFGSTPTQTNPFGSTNQQSQPAFGSTYQQSLPAFGSTTAFGSTNQQSQPALGSNLFCSSSPFDSSSQSAFGATGTPAFGTTSSAPTFGTTNTSTIGPISTPAFGATTNPVIGATTNLAFGTTSSPAFGSTTNHAFGCIGNALSTPSFGFRSGAGFGAPGTRDYGVSSPPIIGGCFCCSPAFRSTFGSRVALYASTADPNDSHESSPIGELQSISAMPSYKYKCHEELRWEDYLSGDKGGQSTAQPNLQGSSTFSQSNSSPFSTAVSTNPSAHKPSGFSFAPSISPAPYATMPVISRNPFGSTTPASTSPFPSISSNPFATMPVNLRNPFGSTTPASTSPFPSISLNPFASMPVIRNPFGSTTPASTSPFPSISSNPFATMPVTSRNPFGSTTAASTSSSSSISLNHFATTPTVSSNPFASTTSASTFSFPSLPKPEASASFSIPSNHGQNQPSTHSTNTSFGGQLGRIAPTTEPYDESVQTVYGGRRGGSRAAQYSSTTQPNVGSSLFTNFVVMSISAMPIYEDKSLEELRWEDYQSGDKGGPVSIGQSTGGGGGGGGIGFSVSTAQPNLQGFSTFGQSSSNPFSMVISANPFAPKPSGFGTGPSMTISFNSSKPAAFSIPLNPSFSFQSFNVFFNA